MRIDPAAYSDAPMPMTRYEGVGEISSRMETMAQNMRWENESLSLIRVSSSAGSACESPARIIDTESVMMMVTKDG